MRFRILTSLAAVLASMLLAGTAWAAGKAAASKAAPVPALVMPIDFTAVTVGLIGKPSEDADVTADGKEKLEHSLKLALARHGAFSPLPLPELTSEEKTILLEHLTLVRLNVFAHTALLDTGKQQLAPYSIGPGLAFLADRSGAECLVYLFGRKSVTSTAAGTLEIVGSMAVQAAATFVSPVVPLALKNTWLGAAVIDLRTGHIRWMNFVQDISANVAERGGANAYMLPTFGDYPKSRLGNLDELANAPPGKLWKDHTANFAVNVPGGWLQMPGWSGSEVALTRHGPSIESISIARRRLNLVFKGHTAEQLRAMQPVDLARLLVEKTQSQPGEEGVEAEKIEPVAVAGRPGFRLDLRTRQGEPGSIRALFRHRIYGVIFQDSLYLLRAEGPVGYYEEALPDFEAMVASFELGRAPSSSKPDHAALN